MEKAYIKKVETFFQKTERAAPNGILTQPQINYEIFFFI